MSRGLLRQTLAPYLQKILDWFRDHRGEFVKWGTVLVTVFKTGAILAKALWNALKSVVGLIQPLIRSVFKGGLSDFVNLMLTKIALVVEWISQGFAKLLPNVKPLVDAVGEIGRAFLNFTGGLFEGFLKRLETNGAAESVRKLTQALDDLVKTLFGDYDWKAIGEQIGQALADGLKIGLDVITFIIGQIDYLVQSFKAGSIEIELFSRYLKGIVNPKASDAPSWKNYQGSLDMLKQGRSPWTTDFGAVLFPKLNEEYLRGQAIQKAIEGAVTSDITAVGKAIKAGAASAGGVLAAGTAKPRNAWADFRKLEQATSTAPNPHQEWVGIHDAVITKEGRIIKTDPEDDIFARKRRSPAGAQVSFGNIAINVTGDQRKTGLIDDITRQFREKVYGVMVAQGYR